jgi:hypothetical protein
VRQSKYPADLPQRGEGRPGHPERRPTVTKTPVPASAVLHSSRSTCEPGTRTRPGATGTLSRPATRRREQHTGRSQLMSPLMSPGKHTGASTADRNGSSP